MIWLVLLLILGLVGAWLIAQVTQTPLADAQTAPSGQFVHLSGGKTHFTWHGPETGPVVICIHGLSTPSYVWDALTPLLVAQGYRVLTYDLYGRGLSDRASGPQTREFFMRQLRDLIAAQEITEPVTLCGYSMGGAIATARAVEAPDSVARLILIAPAGLEADLGVLARFAAQVPILGDWLHAVCAPLVMHWQLLRSPQETPAAVAVTRRLQADYRVEGTMAAILSSLRNLLAEDMREDHRLIAKAGVPVLAIWGVADTVIPISAMGRLIKENRKASQVQIADADHRLVFTHAADVADAIDDDL